MKCVTVSVDVAKAAKGRVVARQGRHIRAGRGKDAVAVETLEGAEVEHEHIVAAHKGKHLVVVLLPQLLDRLGLEVVYVRHEFYHGVVEGVEEAVLQVLAVDEVPLAPSVFIAPAVAFAGGSQSIRDGRTRCP